MHPIQRQALIEYLICDRSDRTYSDDLHKRYRSNNNHHNNRHVDSSYNNYKQHAPRNNNGIILPYSSNLAWSVFDCFGNYATRKILSLSNEEQQSQLIKKLYQ